MNVSLKPLIGKLNDTSRGALEAAAGLCLTRTHYDVDVEHFLLKLVEVTDGDVSRIIRHYGADSSRVARDLNPGDKRAIAVEDPDVDRFVPVVRARLNPPRLSCIDDEVYTLDVDHHVRLFREVEFFDLYFSARIVVGVSRRRGYSAVKIYVLLGG